MNIREEVLNALIHLGTNGPTDGQYGICYEVHHLMEQSVCEEQWPENWEDQVDNYLEELMLKWPKHSGSRAYPIPDPSGVTPPSAYFWATMHGNQKWDGKRKYGQLRWELLQFCINSISTSPQG